MNQGSYPPTALVHIRRQLKPWHAYYSSTLEPERPETVRAAHPMQPVKSTDMHATDSGCIQDTLMLVFLSCLPPLASR